MSKHIAKKWSPRPRRERSQDSIGDNLRRAFCDERAKVLPDRFQDLLDRLDGRRAVPARASKPDRT